MCLNYISLMSFGGLERVKSGLEKENLIKGNYSF